MTNAAKKQLESPEVLNWLTLKFADWLEVLPDELDPQQPISSYGLDSISAVTLSVNTATTLPMRWSKSTVVTVTQPIIRQSAPIATRASIVYSKALMRSIVCW